MGISLDFSGVQSNDFAPLPKGTYHATIFEVTQTETKKGDPMLVFQFKIVEEKHYNRRAFLNHVILPKTLWSLKNTLLAAGYSKEELAGQLDLDLDDMCGRLVRIVIGHEVYEGETRDRVKKVLPPAKGFKPFNEDEVPTLGDEPEFDNDIDLSSDDLPFDIED